MRSLQVRPSIWGRKQSGPPPQAAFTQSFACSTETTSIQVKPSKARVTRPQGVIATVLKRQPGFKEPGTWKPLMSRTCSLCMTLHPQYWLTSLGKSGMSFSAAWLTRRKGWRQHEPKRSISSSPISLFRSQAPGKLTQIRVFWSAHFSSLWPRV